MGLDSHEGGILMMRLVALEEEESSSMHMHREKAM